MRRIGFGLFLAAFTVAAALAQKPDAPAPKKPAATKPADKPTPKVKPAAKSANMPKPVARRVEPPPVLVPAPYVVRVIYQGDVPTDPARRPWQPPLPGQR